MTETVIRRAKLEDVPALLEIYNYYVLNTPVTFDVEPRSLAQRLVWFGEFSTEGRYQCFVAEHDGRAIGWASSGKFKEKPAYGTSVETSVYLAPGEGGKGLGHRLYGALFEALQGADLHRAYGGVALPNEASIRLHEAAGFHHVGTYREVGRKFGRFWDVAWYERSLAQALVTQGNP
jgi:phosphinothricin acetyltransferase